MTLVIAHRGASAAAAENTLEAFRLARELGADWVELDARRSADGVVVVSHDACLPDGRMIVETNCDDLPESVPSLAEALEACDSMGVNIEIKNLPEDPDYDADNAVSDAVAGLVQAYLGSERSLVTCFNVDTLARLEAVDPTIPRGWLTFDMGNPASAVERASAHGMTTINPFDSTVDASFVRRAHEADIEVHVWTVDDPERMEQLIGFGVDGIITNVPDVGREVVDRLSAGS